MALFLSLAQRHAFALHRLDVLERRGPGDAPDLLAWMDHVRVIEEEIAGKAPGWESCGPTRLIHTPPPVRQTVASQPPPAVVSGPPDTPPSDATSPIAAAQPPAEPAPPVDATLGDDGHVGPPAPPTRPAHESFLDDAPAPPGDEIVEDAPEPAPHSHSFQEEEPPMSAQITGTTGTFTNPRVEAVRQDGGSTVAISNVGGTDFDSQNGVRTDANGFQELNSFLRYFAQLTGQDPRAALVQLQMMINDMLRNPEVRRIYVP